MIVSYNKSKVKKIGHKQKRFEAQDHQIYRWMLEKKKNHNFSSWCQECKKH